MKVVAVVCLCVALVYGYPQGPPIDTVTGMCEHMSPQSGHGGMPQTVPPPFELVVSSECYKENSQMHVRIQIKDKAWYVEGFFVQARKGSDVKMAYGTFDVTADSSAIQPLTCFNQPMSAIGHSAKAHYWVRTFIWKAPSSDVGTLHFSATLVKNQLTYWMNVTSVPIMYKSDCAMTTTLGVAPYPDLEVTDKPTSHEVVEPNSAHQFYAHVTITLLLVIAAMWLKK